MYLCSLGLYPGQLSIWEVMILSAARFEESSPLAKSTRHIYGKCKISQQNCVACRSGKKEIYISSFMRVQEKNIKIMFEKIWFQGFLHLFCWWSMDVVMPLQLFCQGLQQESYTDGLMIYYSLNKSFCQVDKWIYNKKCTVPLTNSP